MFNSWNNCPKGKPKKVVSVHWADQQGLLKKSPVIPYGMGRSYGDVCLNHEETILFTQPINHFIHFDEISGVLRCEAGAVFKDISNAFVPRGFMLPVVPGTEYVTVGGAIANDIHGKNHHQAGSFGCHVKKLALLRSDNNIIICSPEENSDLFYATIGGLGLTGLILWADICLKKITNPYLVSETLPFYSLAEFFAINNESVNQFEHTVAWLDCQASGKKMGRGMYLRANWLGNSLNQKNLSSLEKKSMTVPINFPSFTLNKLTMKSFNSVYFKRSVKQKNIKLQHFRKFFFPLDNIKQWNRIYGKRGFFQYQFVLPMENALSALKKLLQVIVRSGQGSFLSVLKTFGNKTSNGLLSFPKEGVTLALDFPNKGEKTLELLSLLDVILLEYNGRLYPAKDARMKADNFSAQYQNLRKFKDFVDPKFSSNFSRRVLQL